MNENDFREKLKAFKDLSSAFFPTGIILCAIELGVFTGLTAGPSQPEELAERLGVDARALGTLMAALASLGYLEHDAKGYRNTPFSERALARDQPDYQGDSALMSLWFLRLMGGLSEVIRTGRARETFEEAVRVSPERSRVLVRAMDQITWDFTASLLKHVDMTGVRRLLDVGGAGGSFAMALLQGRENVEATVFELPHIAGEARRLIKERGMEDRVRFQEGDFRTDLLGEGYDLVFCSNIFHLCDGELCRTVIEKAASALEPGGRLVVKDMLGDSTARQSPALTIYSVLMLLISRGGALHDEQAYMEWCAAAGLERPQRIDCWERSSLLIARKPI